MPFANNSFLLRCACSGTFKPIAMFGLLVLYIPMILFTCILAWSISFKANMVDFFQDNMIIGI